MIHQELQGKLALLLTAVLWSTSGLFIKIVDWHPVLIAGSRSFLAAVFMLFVRRVFQRKRLSSLRLSLHSPACLLTGVSYCATMLLFVVANKYTASANAILLQYSAPIWTAFLGWILIKEKPRIKHWIGMLFVFAGLMLFFKDALGRGSLFGDLLAVASGITFGASSVFMRMRKDGAADGMLLSNILTALIAVPFFFLSPPLIDGKTAGAVFFMGFFQIGMAAVLFSCGIARSSAIAAMLIVAVEPILNPLWVFLATGERPSPDALLGGGIIVAAVLITNISRRRPE